MEPGQLQAVIALLVEAEDRHGIFERDELHGVYDERWPEWYARFAVDGGLGRVLARPVSTGPLSDLLRASYEDFKRGADPDEPWAAYTARRIVSEL